MYLLLASPGFDLELEIVKRRPNLDLKFIQMWHDFDQLWSELDHFGSDMGKVGLKLHPCLPHLPHLPPLARASARLREARLAPDPRHGAQDPAAALGLRRAHAHAPGAPAAKAVGRFLTLPDLHSLRTPS